MTYVIDNNLILQSKFTEKPLQFHQGFAIMDGETTYLTHKNAIYSERIIESSEMEQIKMKISKESITILEDNKEIGKIQNNENTNPYRAWIKKQEDGKTYELVIQSSKMDLNLFTLTSSKKK